MANALETQTETTVSDGSEARTCPEATFETSPEDQRSLADTRVTLEAHSSLSESSNSSPKGFRPTPQRQQKQQRQSTTMATARLQSAATPEIGDPLNWEVKTAARGHQTVVNGDFRWNMSALKSYQVGSTSAIYSSLQNMKHITASMESLARLRQSGKSPPSGGASLRAAFDTVPGHRDASPAGVTERPTSLHGGASTLVVRDDREQHSALGAQEERRRTQLTSNTCPLRRPEPNRAPTAAALDWSRTVTSEESAHLTRDADAKEALSADKRSDSPEVTKCHDAAEVSLRARRPNASRSSPVAAANQISSEESHSEAERVAVQVVNHSGHSALDSLKQGALSKLVDCHRYRCTESAAIVDPHLVGNNNSNSSSCRSTIAPGFNGNVLKPGIVCRESRHSLCVTFADKVPTANGSVNGKKFGSLADLRKGRAAFGSHSSRQYPFGNSNCFSRPEESPPESSGRKRQCKSLTDLTAEDFVSGPCTSIHDSRQNQQKKLSASQVQLRGGTMSNGRSRIVKLITGHSRPTAQSGPASTGVESDQSKKMTKRNGSNGLRSRFKADPSSAVDKKTGGSTSPGRIGSVSSSSGSEPSDPAKSPALSGGRKAPKLPKALFPFMRKNRKRQSATATGTTTSTAASATQRQPLKARGPEPDSKAPRDETEQKTSGKTKQQAPKVEEIGADPSPAVGFRKIKVNSSPGRRNVHADYASRVTRERRRSSSNDRNGSSPIASETPPTSAPTLATEAAKAVRRSSGNFDGNHGGVVMRADARPRRKPRLRYSVEISSSSERLDSDVQRPARPVSFTGGERFLIGAGSRDPIVTSQQESQTVTVATADVHTGRSLLQSKARNHSYAARQSTVEDELARALRAQAANRRSLNLDCPNLAERITFVASLPGPETAINGSKSSSCLTGISTPRSHMGRLSVPHGASLSSSFASVFEDELLASSSRPLVVGDSEAASPPDDGESPVREQPPPPQPQPQRVTLRMRRSQSLCKDKLTLKIAAINRRSVSPSFNVGDDAFGPSRSIADSLDDEQQHQQRQRPPGKQLERRFQSCRDFGAAARPSQPIKPTTPKPRKMSAASGGSNSSLNRFSFRLSQQNLATWSEHQRAISSNAQPNHGNIVTSVESQPDIALVDNAEARHKKQSAKNASIRRRMSLQFLKPLNRDREDDVVVNFDDPTEKVTDEWRRHSLAELDMDQSKSGAGRSSASSATSGSATGSRSARRRIRPLSEVQNLRWEVHAIPEHKEISTCGEDKSSAPAGASTSNATSNPRPRSLQLKNFSVSAIGGAPQVDTCRECGSPRIQSPVHAAPPNDHSSSYLAARLRTLGSSFSEENLSALGDEQSLPRVQMQVKAFSVIGGLNTMPESLVRFYPPKYYVDLYCSCRVPMGGYQHHPTSGGSGSARAPDQLSPFGHGLSSPDGRSRVRGSTVSGISNESGYGTMTRKGNQQRTADDEDVFISTNASRRNGQDPNSQNQHHAHPDGIFVEALWDHVTMDDDELGFKVGDVIRVIDMSNADWWWGELDSSEGWFPATFVRILVNQQLSDDDEVGIEIVVTPSPNMLSAPRDQVRTRSGSDDLCQCTDRRSNTSIHCPVCGRPLREAQETPRARSSTNSPPKPDAVPAVPAVTPVAGSVIYPRKQSLSKDTIRINVINEIVSSEKVFVGHLKDVVQGYLARCRNRPDIFTEAQIATIFGNIEQILHFQTGFFQRLEASVNRDCIHATQLGNVFIEHRDGFGIYSEYCNNHPQALAQLSQLLAVKKYVQFLEACRLLQRMIDIPLDGFLLTPVQKICKYPLQLAELLKYTSPEHPDYEPVKSALEAMKGVARMINERKRHMENIRKISLWQSSILNWQDDDVLTSSSELVHSGEVYAHPVAKGKPKMRTAFLFDRQIIFCKKDILRRDLLYYKSRVNLDACEVVALEVDSPRNSSAAGADSIPSGASGSQRGWKITERATGETTHVYCKGEEDFNKWTKAFNLERKISSVARSDLSEEDSSLAKELLQKNSTLSRRPKEATSVRLPLSYRYRVKMAQGVNDLSNKQKNITVASEKSAGFFSSMAGKLTPFRRTPATRESSFVF